MSAIAKSILPVLLNSMLAGTLYTKYYYNLYVSHEETETRGY